MIILDLLFKVLIRYLGTRRRDEKGKETEERMRKQGNISAPNICNKRRCTNGHVWNVGSKKQTQTVDTTVYIRCVKKQYWVYYGNRKYLFRRFSFIFRSRKKTLRSNDMPDATCNCLSEQFQSVRRPLG